MSRAESEAFNDSAINRDMDACFTAFDKNCDGFLNIEEFYSLCQALFRDANDKRYNLEPYQLRDIFEVFDKNGDKVIDKNEFQICWNNWIKTIVKPVSALLIVDVQNDFISGTLDIRNCPAGQNGEDVVKPINRLLETVEFDAVFYSFDWHPSDHVSFIDNVNKKPLHSSSPVNANNAKVFDTVVFEGDPPMSQKLWPSHCVQNTWGSELHKDLKVVNNGVKIYKGTNPNVDSYSVFWDNMRLTDTKLDSQFKSKQISDVYICGLAYDVCVGATAIDSISAGYRTILLDDCSRGVDLKGIEDTKQKILKNHGLVVHSASVIDMVSGRDRRPELGYKLARELGKIK